MLLMAIHEERLQSQIEYHLKVLHIVNDCPLSIKCRPPCEGVDCTFACVSPANFLFFCSDKSID